MNSIDLINKPVSTKNYRIYDTSKLPKVFLGIRVKNRFDETRIKIKTKYKPQLISHFKTDTQLEPIYLYGIEISPKQQYINLLHDFAQIFTPNTSYEYCLSKYKNMLCEFDLSCDTCYKFFSDGVYPIDIKHLSDISKKNYNNEISAGFQSMVKKTPYPWYATLLNFNIFALCRSSGYNIDYQLNMDTNI